MLITKYLLFHCLLCFQIIFQSSCAIHLENNGYKNVVISFSSSVTYNDVNAENLKSIFHKASKRLLHATKRRAYFSEVILSMPPSWPKRICEGHDTVDYLNHDGDIIVIKSQNLSTPLTQHSRGCGEMGEVIYLPTQWLDGDVDVISRLFLQQWAFYRYGVFDETPISKNSCYMDYPERNWLPAGCYDIRTPSEMTLDSDGLPRCDFSADPSSIRSSLLFLTEDLPNVTDFCDGSKMFPHSPINPTLHNNLCEGKSAWEVIKNTQDFKYGISLLDASVEPQTMIKCYYESENPGLLIVVQNSSAKDVTRIITEFRYTILRFLLYDIPSDLKPSIMTFSDVVHEIIDLNVQDPKLLGSYLKDHIRVSKEVENVCIVCAIEEINKVWRATGNYDDVVVFTVFASSLEAVDIGQFKRTIQKLTQKLYFVVLQDTENDVVLQNIVLTIYDVRGQVFLIPIDPLEMNMKLSMALTSLTRSREQDVFVIHQATFSNIEADIVDEFTINGQVQGHLLYVLKCNDLDMLNFDNSSCGSLPNLPDSAYTCGNHSSLKLTNVPKTWKFNFRYYKGVNPLSCVSLATVKASPGKKDPLTFRGWLNHKIIKPHENAQIIYAEILHDYFPMENMDIVAHVYEPFTDVPIILPLRDNGNGDPDVKKGDGIYSRYFTTFTKKGVYSVFVQVNSRNGPKYTDEDFQNNTAFFRIAFVGTFLLENVPTTDVYPPNRIVDLQVLAVDHINATVKLQWTAPGNNYDDGQASDYVVEYWNSSSNHMYNDDLRENVLKPVDNQQLEPSSSGLIQTATFQLPKNNDDEAVYYISIRAVDNHQNEANHSNLIEVYAKNTAFTTNTPSPITLTITIDIATVGNETNVTVSTEDVVDSNETLIPTMVTQITTVSSTDCPTLNYVILLASSIGGGILLLIIIINIVICVCYFRRNRKRLSKQSSMELPKNMSIKLQPINHVSNSTDSFDTPSRNSTYDLHNLEGHELRLNPPAYNNRPNSLVDHSNNYMDYRGYQVVTATPAYATADIEWQQHPNADSQPSSNYLRAPDTRVYSLGMV